MSEIHPPESVEWAARKLVRAARLGTLATQAAGQPFAGLVTPAASADGTVLLLLSDLSEHTRQLRSDPRCALLLAGEAPDFNPQTTPRVTLLGEAALEGAAAARSRYLAVHPYAAFYAGFGDFNVWRLRASEAAFVGGFARAARIAAAAMAPDPEATARLERAADGIMSHCNADHADTLALLSGLEAARMVGVDTDGCDIGTERQVRRIAWGQPADSAADVRRELILLARTARGDPRR